MISPTWDAAVAGMTRRSFGASLSCLIVATGHPLAFADEQPKIRFNLGWQPAMNGARFFIAEAEGLFAQEGLDINLLKFTSGAAFYAAFQSASIDMGFFGIPPAATAVAQGIPIRIVAVESDSGNAEALVARNGSGIRSIADLRGKRVATKRGSSAHTSLLMGLQTVGLSEKDIQFIDIDVVALLPAFRKKDIDAAWFWEPWMGLLKREGGSVIATDRDIKKPDGIVWAARQSWLQQNSVAMQRFLRILDKAAVLIRQSPEKVSAPIASRLGLSEEHVLEVLTKETVWPTNAESVADDYVFSMSTAVVRAGGGLAGVLTRSAEFQKSVQIIDSVPDYSSAVDPTHLSKYLSKK